MARVAEVPDGLLGLPATPGVVGSLEGRQCAPVVCSAERTTLCIALRSVAVALPYRAVMQPNSMLWMVLLYNTVRALVDRLNFVSLRSVAVVTYSSVSMWLDHFSSSEMSNRFIPNRTPVLTRKK